VKRKLQVAGWVLIAIFFLMGVIGAFPLDSVNKWFGLAIWGVAFVMWIVVGWRSTKTQPDKL